MTRTGRTHHHASRNRRSAASPPRTTGRSTPHRATWRRPPGFLGWLTTTDHKEIGLRFIITAFIVFLLAGLLALAMRAQLAVPREHLPSRGRLNQFFTTHGTAMMFLFAVPVMEGFGLYLVPLMVGTRNVSFPRLLNFSYWVYWPPACCFSQG